MTARNLSFVSCLCLAIFSYARSCVCRNWRSPSNWQMNLPHSVTPMLNSMKNLNELLLIIIVAVVPVRHRPTWPG